MERQPGGLGSGLSAYLFIYLVRGLASGSVAATRYCTVVALGRTLEGAERIAINRVHQQGLHIVRADTATAAPWLDPARDADYLEELSRYGCGLKLGDGAGALVSASAA